MTDAVANSYREPRFAEGLPLCAGWDRLHDLIRKLFPVKTAAYLAEATGLSHRAAQLSLRERRQFAPDTLVALLDTPHGPDVLMALLDHSEQPWVKDFKKIVQLEKLKAQQAELQKRIDALSK